jgi:hypothetical protein
MRRSGWFNRLRERGVLRVAASYGVIAWLGLQIASVVLDPLGLPKWVMTALIIAAAAGFRSQSGWPGSSKSGSTGSNAIRPPTASRDPPRGASDITPT